MRILSRCSDIVVANIHAMLDRLESPEAMIGQIIREMEDGLALARSYAASAIAAERRLGRELSQQHVAVELWRAKARAAVAANRDDLARLALARKQEHAAMAADLEAQHAAAVETSAQVRASLNTLQDSFAAAQRKQKSLIARHRAAQLRQQTVSHVWHANWLRLAGRRQAAALGGAADRPGRRRCRPNRSSGTGRRGNDVYDMGSRGRARARIGRAEGRADRGDVIGFLRTRFLKHAVDCDRALRPDVCFRRRLP